MTATTVLPYAVATLQICAGVVYAAHGQWRNAIVWFAVGIANFSLARLK